MAFILPTSQGRPVSAVIPVPIDVTGYTLSIEFSDTRRFAAFTTKPITGDGREVFLDLTAEEVDELQRSHFRIRAIKGSTNRFLQLGTLDYTIMALGPITGPQGPAGIQGLPGPVGSKGDKGDPGPGYTPEQLALIDSATFANVPGTIVRRSEGEPGDGWSGGVGLSYLVLFDEEPADYNYAVRKDYVDGQIATLASSEHDHSAASISDSSAVGRSLITAASATEARTAIGASDLVIGTTATTAAAGNHSHSALNTATGAATINTLVKRNGNGDASFGRVYSEQPTSNTSTELTRKDYVDALGTSSPVANTIARRNSGGSIDFTSIGISSAPWAAGQATRKDYVDGAVQDALLRSFLGNSLWNAGGAEAFPRPTNNVQLIPEFLFISLFTAPLANTITKLGFGLNQPGSNMIGFRLGLCTVSGDNLTLVARTDSDPTLATGAAGFKTAALSTVGGYPASYTFVPGQRYAFLMRPIGTTMPTVNSYFTFELAAFRPYMTARRWLGTSNADMPTGTFAIDGPWWNAPYICGVA